MADFIERKADGSVELRVRLTPGARKEEAGGLFLDASGRGWLKASVRAVPEKGLANVALVALIAKTTGIAKSRIVLQSGSTARTKALEIKDCSNAEWQALVALGG